MISCLFLVALWSPAGKGLTSWLSCLLCFVTFPNMSWSTSELRARLTPCDWFKPSSEIFLLTVPGRCFFCGSFVSCVSLAFASVRCCLVVACWERADLLALVCGVCCVFVAFQCEVLGQVWYLIVSFPDLCCFSYFQLKNQTERFFFAPKRNLHITAVYLNLANYWFKKIQNVQHLYTHWENH